MAKHDFKNPKFVLTFRRFLAIDDRRHADCPCAMAVTNEPGCHYGHWVITNSSLRRITRAHMRIAGPPVQLGPTTSQHGGRHRYSNHPPWVYETVRALPRAMAGCEPHECDDGVATATALVADYLLYSQLTLDDRPIPF